jgi:hypothetical protein
MNWALNAYPLLRPALSTLYSKIAGKNNPHQLVWVSVTLCRELHWFVEHVLESDGVHLLQSVEWDPLTADLVFFTDACPFGLAFWSPNLMKGFQAFTPSDSHQIFFLEAYAITSALSYATSQMSPPPRRVVIYTDSSNTVDLFNTLHASPDYNPLLLTAVDSVLRSQVSFRVLHIPGHDNVVADALSRFQQGCALSAAPQLYISSFQPPRLTLGAVKK